MANIILRANIADKNVRVEYKVLSLPLLNNEVELIISPIEGVSIQKQAFSHGPLPKQIQLLIFKQFGSKVIAKIKLSSNIDSKVTQNISLPIISKSMRVVDKFKLIDNTSLNSSNIIVNTISNLNKSIEKNKTVYSGSNTVGNKMLVLSKTIIATNNYHFIKEPSYSITGNKDRYTSIIDVKRNNSGNIISKTFNIYYTSPNDLKTLNSEDIIYFKAQEFKLIETSLETNIATKKEEYEIYSFDPGIDIGPNGGVKRMVIKGMPGSRFKILLQDSNKKTYNFKTGVFELGGGMLEGVIPPILGTRGYGEYTAYAKIPRSIVTNQITTNFINDKPIDHEELLRLTKEKGHKEALAYIGISKSTIEKVNVSSSITFSLFSSGFTIPYTNTKGTANLIVGPGKFGQEGDDATFDITLRAATAQVIRIERQPLHSTTEAYVNWDSGSDKADALTSAGVTIPNDWYVADAKDAKYNIKTKCIGIGEAHGTYTDGYKEISIKGKISGVAFGTGDIGPSLDLLNFLTLQAL